MAGSRIFSSLHTVPKIKAYLFLNTVSFVLVKLQSTQKQQYICIYPLLYLTFVQGKVENNPNLHLLTILIHFSLLLLYLISSFLLCLCVTPSLSLNISNFSPSYTMCNYCASTLIVFLFMPQVSLLSYIDDQRIIFIKLLHNLGLFYIYICQMSYFKKNE